MAIPTDPKQAEEALRVFMMSNPVPDSWVERLLNESPFLRAETPLAKAMREARARDVFVQSKFSVKDR